MVPFLRDLGSSYSLATDWEVNRFAFSTSNGRFASLFDLIQQISFSILLLRAISKSRKANWLVISCSVFGLIIYSLMAVANNAGDLTSVLFGNVPTTVFIIPLFYLLSEDPRIEQLIKEWVPLLSLICFIASLASIIKFKKNNTITVHIRHLREKMKDSFDEPRYIKTIWGCGYKIEK